MEDKLLLDTDEGPLWVTPTQLALWIVNGWPDRETLRWMVEGQRNG